MKYPHIYRSLLFVSMLCVAGISYSAGSVPSKGNLVLSGTTTKVWGSYKIHQVLFPAEEWQFFVIVVPKNTQPSALINIAKNFFLKYPNVRARFFSDTKYIQQYADRDIYINDKSGRAKEVEFPDSAWVQDNLLGNINNRSKTYNRHWLLEDRYGNNISLLP